MDYLILFHVLLALCAGLDCGTTPENTPHMHKIQSKRGRSLFAQDRSATDAPIRITFHFFDDFTLGDAAADTQLRTVVLPAVEKFMEKLLMVKSITGDLEFDASFDDCGDEVIVPQEHRDNGIPDTDLLIYVVTFSEASSTLAKAGPCAQESGGRTNVLAGRIVINTQTYPTKDFNAQFVTLVHEITHILGFITSAYDSFVDLNGVPHVNPIVQQTVRGVLRSYLTTPTVVTEARRIFDCPTLIGMEFEEFGANSTGSATSHWDMRVGYSDYMNSQIREDAILSPLTLALLKDTGWYTPDFSLALDPLWGFGRGCDFIEGKCIQSEVPAFPEFCNEEQASTCDLYRLFEGKCNLNTGLTISETEFQYYSDTGKGGDNSLVDYCPFRTQFSNRSCRDKDLSTFATQTGQSVGVNSRCLEGNLFQDEFGVQEDHTGCYEVVSCDATKAVIRLDDGGTTSDHDCPFIGGVIENVPGFNGFLTCPDSDILCADVPCFNSCYGCGTCSKGVCSCDAGRTGDDCSLLCHNSCETCTGTSNNECTSCTSSDATLDNGDCVCNLNFIEENTTGGCVAVCKSLCETCPENDPDTCTMCVDNADPSVATLGACECKDGFTDTLGECIDDCGTLCETCGAMGCEMCVDNASDGLFGCECNDDFFESSGACVPCSTICDGCSLDTGLCEACITGASRVAATIADDFGDCECDSDTYFTSDMCTPCDVICNGCSPDTGLCGDCISGAERIDAGDFGECQCSANSYFDSPNCVDCDNLCDGCNPDSGLCVNCVTGAEQVAGTIVSGESECECTEGSGNVNGNCIACSSLCVGCDPDDPTLCDNCVANAARVIATIADTFGECECNLNLYNNNGVCVACDTICDGCNPADGLCEGCITGASRVAATIADEFGECECDSDTYFTSDMCTPCDVICNGCSPDTGLCEGCIENAGRVTATSGDEFGNCECHAGYEFSMNQCVVVEEPLASFIFNLLTSLFQSLGFNAAPGGNPSVPDNTPAFSPNQGYYFDSNDFMLISPTTGLGTLVANSLTISMWIRFDILSDATILIVVQPSILRRLSGDPITLVIDDAGTVTLTVMFDSGSETLTAPGIVVNEWTKIGFSLVNNSGVTRMSIYINGVEVSFKEVTDVFTYPNNALTYLGSDNGVEGITGFILNYEAAFGYFDNNIENLLDFCLDEACVIIPTDCGPGEAETATGCETCPVECDVCFRPTDCNFNQDPLCGDTDDDPYTCANCVSFATKDMDGVCQCDSGYEDIGTSCNFLCDELCANCNEITQMCDMCGSHATPNAGVCECDSGFVKSGSVCVAVCVAPCVLCSPDDGTLCSSCIDNAFLNIAVATNDPYYDCPCNLGFEFASGACVSTGVPIGAVVFTTYDVVFDANELVSVNLLNSNPPKFASLMGLYFNDDTAEVSIHGEGDIDETIAVSMWVNVEMDGAGSLVIVGTKARLRRLDLTTVLLDFRVEMGGILKISIVFNDASTGMVGADPGSVIPIGVWVKLGFSLEFSGGNTIVSLLVNGVTVLQSTFTGVFFDFPESGTMYLGGCPPLTTGFTGFILSFVLSVGYIDDDLNDVTGPFIDDAGTILAQNCPFGQVFENGSCQDCPAACDTCFRTTDCRQNFDELCDDTDNDPYSCISCVSRADFNGVGHCTCILNAVFNPVTVACECTDDLDPLTDVCDITRNYFNPIEISALLSPDFSYIVVTFPSEVIIPSTDCADLIAPGSLATLGVDPLCTLTTPTELHIGLGANYDIHTGSIELIAGNIMSATGDGSAPLLPLVIPLDFAGVEPTSLAHITGPDVYSLACDDDDLVLSGAASTGGAMHPLLYFWTVTSTDAIPPVLFPDNESVVIVPAGELTEGTYTFTLIVANIYENYDETSHVVVITSEQVPIVTIDVGSDVVIESSDKALFKFTIADKCGLYGRIRFGWVFESSDDPDFVAPRGIIPGYALYIPPRKLSPGFTYTFKAIVKIGYKTGHALLDIKVTKPDIIAIIAKLDGKISNGVNLYLDASHSYDPSDLEALLIYDWACEGDCVGALGFALEAYATGPYLDIPKEELTVGDHFIFSVTVSASDGRTDTESVELEVVLAGDEVIGYPDSRRVVRRDRKWKISLSLYGKFYNNVAWYQVLGNPIVPSTPLVHPFLAFDEYTMAEGEYYAWAVQYTDKHGAAVEGVFPWTVSQAPYCNKNPEIRPYGRRYIILIEDCFGVDSDESLYYAFTIEYRGKRYPFASLSPRNYFIPRRLPRSEFTIIASVCNSLRECKEYSTTTSVRRMRELEVTADMFTEDIVNPEDTPFVVFYYASSMKLTGEEWDMIFAELESYMTTLVDTNEMIVSSCIIAMTELLEQDVVDRERLIYAVNSIERMLEQEGATISIADIKTIYSKLDGVLADYIDDEEIMGKTFQFIHILLSRYMDDTVPYTKPTVVSTETLYSRKERSTGSDLKGKTIQYKNHELTLPSTLPVEDTAVVDISIIALTRPDHSDIIDITFSVSGTYSDLQLSLTPEKVILLTDLTEPISIEIPIYSTGEWECVYLNEGKWDSTGCSVKTVKSSSVIIEVTHTSIFALRNTAAECTGDHTAFYVISTISLFMGAYLCFILVKKSSAIAHVEKGTIETKNLGTEAPQYERPKIESAFQDVKIESDPVTTSNPQSNYLRRFAENQLVLAQIFNSPQRTTKALLLAISIFTCLSLSSVAVISVEFLSMITLGVTVGVISWALIVVLETLLMCAKSVVKYTALITVTTLGIAICLYTSTIGCSGWATETYEVFGVALCLDLLVLQTAYALLRSSLMKSN